MPTPLRRQRPSARSFLVHDVAALRDALELLLALPPHVRVRTIMPRSASRALEPSLCATRLRAFDANSMLCLYRHEYKLASVDFDAEDTPYVRVTLHETLTAVRTRDGGWLCRTERCEPENTSGHTHCDSGFHPATLLELPPELAAQISADAKHTALASTFERSRARSRSLTRITVRRRSRPTT